MPKNRMRLFVLGLAVLAVAVLLQVGVGAQEPPVRLFINPNPNPQYKAEIWVDRGQGSTYYPGDPIEVYYRANRDSYVYILDIDPSGRSRWLLPSVWFPNNYIRANRAGVLSNMEVTPPSGVEYLIIFASTQQLSLPFLEESVRSGEAPAPYIQGEADIVLGKIQAKIKIAPQQAWVSSYTHFYVGGGFPPVIPEPPVVQPPVPQPVPPIAQYGALNVSSYPSRATVFLDGVQTGRTPMLISNVTFGSHEVTIVLPGYYSFTRKFELNYAQTYYVSTSLQRIP